MGLFRRGKTEPSAEDEPDLVDLGSEYRTVHLGTNRGLTSVLLMVLTFVYWVVVPWPDAWRHRMFLGLAVLAVAMWKGWRGRRDADGRQAALAGFWISLALAISVLVPFLVYWFLVRM